MRQRRQSRIAFAADIAGEQQMPRRRAVRKKRRRKDRAENFETLDLGNQHTKSFAWMRNILAAKTQRDGGYGRITNLRKSGKTQRRVRLNFQFGQSKPSSGINDRTVVGTRLPARFAQLERPATGGFCGRPCRWY